MSLPRRSARLAPHQSQPQQSQYLSSSLPVFTQSTTASTFSQPSSSSTTSHPSPVNDTINPPPPPPTPYTPGAVNAPPRLGIQTQPYSLVPQHPHLHAPLPSPSAHNPDPFFGGRPHSQPIQHSFMQNYHQPQPQNFFAHAQNQTHSQLHPQYQQSQHHNSMSQYHLQGSTGQVPPPDFLAEAAKRAQMACLMRDLGDVSL